MKSAIVTGITGQDGAYLTQHLLALGYKVYGGFRRTSSHNFWRLKDLGVYGHENLTLIELDVTDLSTLIRLISDIEPDEFYNLAAQSFVGVSFQQPIATGEITGIAVTNILEAIRIVNPKIRFYQASTSEMFGLVQEVPQTEATPFYPRSPYGVAKLYAHWMTVNYRESYNIFASSGILFNHESPLRGLEFVTRKITDGAAKVKLGLSDRIELGNMDAMRDWGYAKEYCEGMHLILQADQSDTFVLATNQMHSVRDFVLKAFQAVDMELEFSGEGVDEIGVDVKTGKTVVAVNPAFYRDAEVDQLLGQPTKAKEILGWEPKTQLDELCNMMVKADIYRNENGISY